VRTQIFLRLTLFLLVSHAFAQNRSLNFGKITEIEKNLTVYAKDSSAGALVLYERGDNYFKVFANRILLVKEYHTKIKILDEKGFDEGTISIPLYHSGTSTERVTKIKAVTHNGDTQFNVLPSEIYTSDLSEKWKEQKFTFPKLQIGSILEYSYTLTSPYIYNFSGWDFQSSIPKMYSEFNAEIPGNYVYNRTLIGEIKLDINDAKVKKECFHIRGFAKPADCEVLKYAIKDIPAFKEEEEFMLSSKNYISRLDFELSQYNRFDGTTDKYTKTWSNVDKEFRSDKNIGRQLTKKGFFEKNVPEKLLTEGDALTKAKNIYAFVQNHFTWNEKFGIYGKARVKEAFENKTGSVGEINMSLINLLNAANISTNLLLLSTRQQGLPKKTHPVMSDFNYFVAKVQIEGKDYLLDATDKFLPFGMLPYRALNHYGRVMDFKEDSYWYDIIPNKKNRYQIRGQLKLDIENQKGNGIFDVVNLGYDAVDTRKAIGQNIEEEYLEIMESHIQGDFEITSYELSKERSNAEKTSERFKFEVGDILNGDKVYINPFFIRFFEQNPFTLEHRNYPIDFGYPRTYKYQMIIQIPEGYSVQEVPENKIINFGEKLIVLKFYLKQAQGQLAVSFDLAMNASHFPATEYSTLKEIFNEVTNIQNNSLIVLKKD
jgi:uncharacterized protein DUF3857